MPVKWITSYLVHFITLWSNIVLPWYKSAVPWASVGVLVCTLRAIVQFYVFPRRSPLGIHKTALRMQILHPRRSWYYYYVRNVIIPHLLCMWVWCCIPTVTRFILTSVLEVLCTLPGLMQAKHTQHQKFCFHKGCVKNHNLQSLLHCQYIL